MKKICCLLLAALMLAGVFSGCQGTAVPSSPSAPETPSGANTESSAGATSAPEQRLVYAMAAEPKIMDPGLNYYLSPSNVLQNVFRGLYKLDADGNTVPCIATGYTLDDTQTVYTFTLRQDVKWCNGKPLNAHDFEYSWKRVIDPATGASTAYAMASIKNASKCAAGELPMDEVGIKALDDYTFQVTLEAPTPWFIDLTASPTFMPVCKDVAQNDGWASSADTFICNGPFMITEMYPKEKYVLKKNPYYFDADKVKLDTIEYVFMDSAESTMIAYNNNEVQFTENISPEAKEQYYGTDEYVTSPKIGVTFYDFNCKKAPFDDARVRKAFTMAICRQDLLDMLEDPEQPAYAYVPVGYYNPADKKQMFRDAAGYNLFQEDIPAAQQLLADAGYPGGVGIPKIELVVGTSQSEKDIAQAMQEMWKNNLGVTVDIVTYDNQAISEQANLGNFSIISDGWTGLYPDPMSILQPLDFGPDSVIMTFWQNQEYHDLLTESVSELDQQKRMDDFVRMEQILMNEMPVMPLFYRSNMYLCKPEVKGLIKNILGHTYLEYTYIG